VLTEQCEYQSEIYVGNMFFWWISKQLHI